MRRPGNYAGPAWYLILMTGADAASSSWKEQIMMNLLNLSRSTAKLQDVTVRLPLTLLGERVIARYWHDQGLFRLSVQCFLGSADELAGWLLTDDDIPRRGQGTDTADLAPVGGRRSHGRRAGTTGVGPTCKPKPAGPLR